MTDHVLVLRKVARMREHAARVQRRRSPDVETFRRNVDLQDATALSLLVAIQEAADLALHIASGEGWGVPASYAEGFETIARHGVIDEDLAQGLRGVIAVRNRIAHGYASVDMERLWSEIPAGLDLLERFAVAVAVFAGDRDTMPGS